MGYMFEKIAVVEEEGVLQTSANVKLFSNRTSKFGSSSIFFLVSFCKSVDRVWIHTVATPSHKLSIGKWIDKRLGRLFGANSGKNGLFINPIIIWKQMEMDSGRG